MTAFLTAVVFKLGFQRRIARVAQSYHLVFELRNPEVLESNGWTMENCLMSCDTFKSEASRSSYVVDWTISTKFGVEPVVACIGSYVWCATTDTVTSRADRRSSKISSHRVTCTTFENR